MNFLFHKKYYERNVNISPIQIVFRMKVHNYYVIINKTQKKLY